MKFYSVLPLCDAATVQIINPPHLCIPKLVYVSSSRAASTSPLLPLSPQTLAQAQPLGDVFVELYQPIPQF